MQILYSRHLSHGHGYDFILVRSGRLQKACRERGCIHTGQGYRNKPSEPFQNGFKIRVVWKSEPEIGPFRKRTISFRYEHKRLVGSGPLSGVAGFLLNPEKTKVILFSRSYLAGKPEPTLKLYGERLKFYPQVKFLGITFDSKFTFKKHFEDILGRCNARYHCIRLLTNKKWGPSPSTILQIYKQCVRPIFEYGCLSTITTSDTIISEIQRLQNKFIRLALRLPKYISVKLLHDSSGLPYVKDRLFSRATKTLERISANPLVEESISSNKVNPAWDRFPTPLSVIRPVSL